MTGIAVLDFETTGLMPERSDRVVEVGVVLTDDHGRVEHEWTTLVNPGRDIGASHIHGLRGADLLDAPDLAELSHHLLQLTAGRAVVAHNATFDMRFLHAELQRAGYEVGERPTAFCSMKWAGRLIGPAKLEHCCEALGIQLVEAHSALADARATAELVSHLLRLRGSQQEWDHDIHASRNYPWPKSRGGLTPPRSVPRGHRTPDADEWLDTVLKAAWIPGTPEDEASYLLVLDRALLDRAVSLTEGRQLAETARAGGLTSATIERLHRTYLQALAVEAVADGVVTESEHADLAAVARALGLSEEDIERSLQEAGELAAGPDHTLSSFTLQAGDRIVFTGDMARPRDEWVATIVALGLATGGVSKSTKLVVSADPDSLSGKAAKARQYGIPVVGEEAFHRILLDFRTATGG